MLRDAALRRRNNLNAAAEAQFTPTRQTMDRNKSINSSQQFLTDEERIKKEARERLYSYRQVSPLLPPEIQIENQIIYDENAGNDIYGSRISKSGKMTNSWTAMKALGPFADKNQNKAIFSIDYTQQELTDLQPGGLVSKITQEIINITNFSNNRSFRTFVDLQAIGANVRLNEQVKTSIRGRNKQIFFIITSIHHAIICIPIDGALFSVGFGYSGAGEDKKIINAIRQMSKYTNKADEIAHTIERIPGALYSADYLVPTPDQSCLVAWVGYLTQDIVQRIEEYLQLSTGVILEGSVNDDNQMEISEEAIVRVNYTYSEASQFLYKNTNNCIKWVQEIAGVTLNCGLTGAPGNCKPLSMDLWAKFMEGYANEKNLDLVIDKIQNNLVPQGCIRKGLSWVCPTKATIALDPYFDKAGLGGRKKTRKFAKKYKNKLRKNKTRKNKTKRHKRK